MRGRYSRKVNTSVKNEPSTSDVEESQFANASITPAPSRMPPVYSMPAMHSTISTQIGRIRSYTLPAPPTTWVSSWRVRSSSACSRSYFAIGPKSKSAPISQIRKPMVSSAYRFIGMVCKNSENPSMVLDSGSEEPTAAAQLEIGAIMHTGAAVASMI